MSHHSYGVIRRSAAALSLAALATLGQSSALAQSSYTVTDLGRLPGTDISYPNKVDATVTTSVKVVGNTVSAGYKYHGFYWNSATKTMTDIGVIGAGTYSEAWDVNSRGEVVGMSTTTSNGGGNHPLYWNPSRGAGRPLDLAPESTTGSAHSINESGIIVGSVNTPGIGNRAVCWIPTSPNSGVYGSATILPLPDGARSSGMNTGRHLNDTGAIAGSISDADGVVHAAFWKNIGTTAAPIYDLPTLMDGPGAAVSSSGTIINRVNQIVGAFDTGTSAPSRAFGWYAGNAAVDLGTFSDNTTQAWGLNDLNQVAVHAPITVGTSYQIRAAVWLPQADPANRLTAGLNLVTTPAGASTLGGEQTRPYGGRFNGMGFTLNNSGQMVGYSTIKAGYGHAILWDKINKMRDLNSTTLTPDKGPFSYLGDASGITENGYIIGAGPTKKGAYTDAFLLTPKP